jgi:hypothetical protein
MTELVESMIDKASRGEGTWRHELDRVRYDDPAVRPLGLLAGIAGVYRADGC